MTRRAPSLVALAAVILIPFGRPVAAQDDELRRRFFALSLYATAFAEGSAEAPGQPVTRQSASSAEGAGSLPIELYTGYAFLRDRTGGVSAPLGWSVSVAGNVKQPWLSLVGDVGGSYRSEAGVDSSVYTFLGGPRFPLRLKGLSLYAEVLAGVARTSVAFQDQSLPGVPTGQRSDFAVQGGIGIDVPLAESFAVRTGIDGRSIYVDGSRVGQLRFIAGVVFRPISGNAGPRGRGTPGETTAPVAPPPPMSPPAQPVPQPPPAAPPAAPPPAPAPRPADVTPPKPPDSFARGTELMRRGSYVEASNAFLDYVRSNAPNRYTIGIGTFCEVENVTRQVTQSGDAGELFLLPAEIGGRPCYRVLWGLFDSVEEARRGMGVIPGTLRARGLVPVALSRLVR